MSKPTNKWDSVLTQDDLAAYDKAINTYLKPGIVPLRAHSGHKASLT